MQNTLEWLLMLKTSAWNLHFLLPSHTLRPLEVFWYIEVPAMKPKLIHSSWGRDNRAKRSVFLFLLDVCCPRSAYTQGSALVSDFCYLTVYMCLYPADQVTSCPNSDDASLWQHWLTPVKPQDGNVSLWHIFTFKCETWERSAGLKQLWEQKILCLGLSSRMKDFLEAKIQIVDALVAFLGCI